LIGHGADGKCLKIATAPRLNVSGQGAIVDGTLQLGLEDLLEGICSLEPKLGKRADDFESCDCSAAEATTTTTTTT